MRKIISLLFIASFLIILSACSSKQSKDENTIANPISDPGGYTKSMINLNKNMKQNIKNSVNQENTNTKKALNDAGISTDQTQTATNPNIPTNLATEYPYAVISTNFGDIKVKLDATNAPMAVNNFLNLAQKKFYNGTKFHRVIEGFMIQGGDPFSKDDSEKDKWGMGGPGYKFADELKGTEKYTQGTLAMANSGPNTNGSQFFVVTADPSYPLPPSYTIFGHIASGLEVALKIENTPTTNKDRPVKDVVINDIKILKK